LEDFLHISPYAWFTQWTFMMMMMSSIIGVLEIF